MASTFELVNATVSRHLGTGSELTRHSDVKPESRIEPTPKPGFPHEKYPRWIGHKFTPAGELLPFPGNTVICHLLQDSPLRRALLELYKDIQDQDFASLFAFLPPSSWHMTVYEGISDQIRKRNCWPGELSLDSPLSRCNAHVEEKLAKFDLGSDPPFHIAIEGFEPLDDGIALKVVPATPAEEERLRGLRDRLSDHLLMLHPGHKTYSFHVSLAYTLRNLQKQDCDNIRAYLNAWQAKLPGEFELGAPELCVFDDMFAFRRLSLLEKKQ